MCYLCPCTEHPAYRGEGVRRARARSVTEVRPRIRAMAAQPADAKETPALSYEPAAAPSSRVVRRLLKLLRPWWGMIGLGLLLLILAAPCELFPALVWKYVTDVLILQGRSGRTPVLSYLFSF